MSDEERELARLVAQWENKGPPKANLRKRARKPTQTVGSTTEAINAAKGLADDRLQALTSTVKQQISCKTCQKVMADPLSIECGHNFCFPCLYKHIDGTLDKFLETNPTYIALSPKVLDLIELYRQPTLSDSERASFAAIIRTEHNKSNHPLYLCPVCGHPISTAPAHDNAIKRIVEATVNTGIFNKPKSTDGTAESWAEFWPPV